jgi:DNA-binding transcriptional MerR regulator
MPQLTVSKLGGRVGVSPDTIRYYERSGLLPAAERTPAGYRLYDEQVAERLRFIKGAQRVGLRLREIRELLEVLDRGLCPCGHAEALVRGRIAEIEGEIAHLRELKRELESLLARYPAEACAADGARWACEAELIRAGEEARDGSS